MIYMEFIIWMDSWQDIKLDYKTQILNFSDIPFKKKKKSRIYEIYQLWHILQVHVLTKEIVFFGMVLSKYVPVSVVDGIVKIFGKLIFGDLSKYGIHEPTMGPFYLKEQKGQAPIIDVGSIEKIKRGEIKVHISLN